MGDVDETAIFTQIGSALTEWENVEVECARLFAVFVSASKKRPYQAPAVSAYGSIVGVSSRRKMLDLASESYFAFRPAKRTTFATRCSQLINEYEKYAARRNELAHGLVKRVFVTKKGTRPQLIGIYLLPSFFNPKKFKKGELTYSYVSGDVVHYRQEFTKLALKIGGLREQLV
jgi:hypothetical protein